MPYTPAHPIMAIAIDKLFPNKFNKTGLVMGTLAPDLLNFVVLRPTDTDFGHSPLGMLTIGLPVSILMCFVFHRLVLPGMVVHLPKPFNRLLYHYVAQGWHIAGAKAWSVLLISIIIGMYSHLFLDGFSHRGGLMYPYTTAVVSWLLPDIRSPGFMIQIGLSMAGIAIELLLLAYILFRRRKAVCDPEYVHGIAKIGYWAVVFLAVISISAIGLLLYGAGHRGHGFMILSIAPLTGAVIGLVTASTAYVLLRKRRTREV